MCYLRWAGLCLKRAPATHVLFFPMQSRPVPQAHTSHSHISRSALCIVTHSFIILISLGTVRVLHTSRRAGGPVSRDLAPLTGCRMPTQPSSRCRIFHGLRQASWMSSDSSPARLSDSRYVFGQPALLHSPPARSRNSYRSPSFTARLCDAATRLRS